MEVLLMVLALQALCSHQGLQGAVISSYENGTDISRSDALGEKQSPGGSPHTASISEDCSGTLLALHQGRWVAVTLTKKDMSQLCKDLGCGGLFAENVASSMNICLSDCTIINSNLYNCAEAAPDNCSNVVEVICAWQAVQLVGGSDRCAGRVELFGTEGWGSVCDDGWDLQGGNVVCAQLGCDTAVRVMGEAGDFEAGSGPIHISELNCSGTERNLWQCATETDKDKNYCGHKEDASVVCSGSSYIPVTTMNTIMPDVTNWTTETVKERVADGTSDGISPLVLGCIVLSVALLLLLLSNAAQCAYYKRQNGGTEVRRASQASHQDNSDTSSDPDYEHYNPDPLPPTTVNNFKHADTLDSESTSSGECYEKIEMQNLLNPAVKQFYPEYCKQTTPLHNTSGAAKNASADSFDSDSTSSGECYENSGVNAESFLHILKENPAVPEQPLLFHPKPQLEENNSVSQPYSSDQAQALDSESTSSEECYENTKLEMDNPLNPDSQVYPQYCTQMSTLHNTSEPANNALAYSFDADSKLAWECNENKGLNSEPYLQTLEGDPALPEQPPLCHPTSQLAENSRVSQPYSSDQDDNSTSSEDPYENVAEIDENYFASEQSIHSSSDSDYDDVGNW